MRKICLILLLLCITSTAFAVQPPDLPGLWAVHGLPKRTTFSVYTGPGDEYFVAAEGRAKVSTNGSILCYGRVDNWLMIYYNTASGSRVGYIDAGAYPDAIREYQALEFGMQRYRLPYGVAITDDPHTSQKSLGTISGEMILLANATIAGRPEWVYVEGVLDKRDGAKVRGFVRKNSFVQAAEPLSCMPDVPDADISLELLEKIALQTATAPVGCMRALPLADGTLALAYSDERSTMLSVHSRTGEALWSQRIFAASKYVSLESAEDGFKVSFYYNYQMMSYTYPLGSQEGTFNSSYVFLETLREGESQSLEAQRMPVPVVRAVAVAETPQGDLVLGSFDDGSGLYLLTEDGMRLVERFSGLTDICDPAEENGVFTLIACGEGQPVLCTYQLK